MSRLILDALCAREAAGQPIHTGVIGAGTAHDGMGGGQVLGLAELATAAAAQRLLPLGLASGVRLRRPVQADAALTYDELEAPGDTPCWRLRRKFGLLPS